jgi:hypothetical protein
MEKWLICIDFEYKRLWCPLDWPAHHFLRSSATVAKPSCSSSMTESLNLTVPFIKIQTLHWNPTTITYEQRLRRQEDDQLKAMRRRWGEDWQSAAAVRWGVRRGGDVFARFRRARPRTPQWRRRREFTIETIGPGRWARFRLLEAGHWWRRSKRTTPSDGHGHRSTSDGQGHRQPFRRRRERPWWWRAPLLIAC